MAMTWKTAIADLPLGVAKGGERSRQIVETNVNTSPSVMRRT
jgi:hypothetical protein